MKITKRNNNYYLDTRLDGKRIRVSLKTSDSKLAHERAALCLNDLKNTKATLKQPLFKELIIAYERLRPDLSHTLRILIDTYGHLKLDEINASIYQDWNLRVSKDYHTESTRNKKRFVMQGLIRFIREQFRDVPELKYKSEKQKQARHYIYTPKEISLLVSHASPYLKDLIHILYRTGMRLSEAINIRSEDVTEGFIHLYKTKSGKARAVPIHKQIRDVLPRFISAERVSIYDIENEFRKLRKQIGLPKEARLHDLRHTFATNLCEKGISIDVVSKLLGHSNIQTTLIYARVSDHRLSQAIKLL
jgi:site-specific recombinase XerD